MTDPLVPEHFADWNEQMIRRYDPEIFHHHPRGMVRWVEKRRVGAVVRELDADVKHRVLDVGCGAGNILEQLPAGEKHGLDLSPYMVKRAKERLGNSAKILRGDAEQLPFENGTFDRVIASSLLSHVLHPEQVVSELSRVTKPDGRIVISICHEDQIERGLRWARSFGLQRLFFGAAQTDNSPQVYNVECHLHHFSPKRLREVTMNRLREVSMVKAPLFIFPVHWIGTYVKT